MSQYFISSQEQEKIRKINDEEAENEEMQEIQEENQLTLREKQQ
jgi:hypothetical protein